MLGRWKRQIEGVGEGTKVAQGGSLLLGIFWHSPQTLNCLSVRPDEIKGIYELCWKQKMASRLWMCSGSPPQNIT
jgi:hypothetical protein